MDAGRAQALTERLHHGQLHRDRSLLIDHVRRVAGAVPANARVVARLHETLEHTPISEHAAATEMRTGRSLVTKMIADIDLRPGHHRDGE